MSFDLPERSPLATLSVIDLSCSQVTSPLSPWQLLALAVLGASLCSEG